MTIRTILVDDEKLAIQGLQLRLEAFPDVEVIDTCSNGREAIRKIKTEKPDLVFCDIQMPGFDGFSVVSGVIEIDPPLFVFVTAYSEHAIRAFEANAVDYLLKPVEQSRLADALDRARTRLAEKRGLEEAEKLKTVLAEVAHQPEFKATKIDFPKTADHIDASATIEKVRLFTRDKAELDHVFRVRAEAWISDGTSRRIVRTMETYVYSPNSPI